MNFNLKMEFRSDIIDIQLILRALKSLHKGLNAEMKINSFQSLNATAKGENFLGDLAALEVFARIEQGNQIQYRTQSGQLCSSPNMWEGLSVSTSPKRIRNLLLIQTLAHFLVGER